MELKLRREYCTGGIRVVLVLSLWVYLLVRGTCVYYYTLYFVLQVLNKRNGGSNGSVLSSSCFDLCVVSSCQQRHLKKKVAGGSVV